MPVAEHTSPLVQALPSLHEAPLLIAYVHVPVAAVQVPGDE